MQLEIRVWNRREKREEIEQVYGDSLIRWVYGSRVGRALAENFLSFKFPSLFYGCYQSSRLSSSKIEPFIRRFNIPMEEFESGPFASFNGFFVRKFRDGVRQFVATPRLLPAFAEGRYAAFERVKIEDVFPVKGKALSAREILGGEESAKEFLGGPMLIARLCPTDYHRFHFPDSGRVLSQKRLPGRLHSVNPLALAFKDDIFSTNERQVSILETESFGRLAYVEVGALCVGKIIQTHPAHQPFLRGDEKGYFLFGASTVIVLGQPGIWRPDRDLLEQTARKRESLVRLGEGVAEKV